MERDNPRLHAERPDIRDFYERVLGWEGAMYDEASGQWLVKRSKDLPYQPLPIKAGQKPPPEEQPRPVVFYEVEDWQQALEAVKDNGGEVELDLSTGHGSTFLCRDRDGNAFGLIQLLPPPNIKESP